MATDTSPTIRLAVWRPVHLDRRLMVGGNRVPSAQDELLEEAYRWETTEDFFGSFEAGQTETLRKALMVRFAPELPPTERTMARLGESLEILANACADRGADGWTDATTTEQSAEASVNLRAQAGLALYHHLRWVYRVFKDVPNVSVTMR